jgi:predicted nucleotidyltransferase
VASVACSNAAEAACTIRKVQVSQKSDLEEVRRIVLRFLENGPAARVYLFGSAARGEACRISDIDVGILPGEPLPSGLLGQIEEALENSRSLYPVDLVDLSTVSDSFRARVLAEGIPWNG